MKRRDIMWTSLLFVLTSFLTIYITTAALLNRSLLPKFDFTAKPTYIASQTCGMGQKIAHLDQAANANLRKLAEYQQVCGSNPAARSMIFTGMPNSDPAAVQSATAMAKTLKEFAYYGVKPLVVMEPTTDWGSIDFQEFKSGFYDKWLNTYFMTLKQQGVTDGQMGMWVPFPEANLPYWNHQNSKPADFAINVTKTVSIQKHYFPKSQASIMLNSATYENDDFDWTRGEYRSLTPYVKDIPKGLIDSFGYQGLPWAPPANQPGAGVLDANEYLNAQLAKEAADQLGVKSIWFNTGTFGRKYTLDADKAITISPERRKDILTAVEVQAKKLRDQGYTVAVNLFAEDKSAAKEATDWSYWPTNGAKNSPASLVFADFATDLHREQIELWVFDTMHD